jgi:threonine/homoserine/homoserine lactone efflux protein
MKNAIHFILTCFISTAALLGATKAHNPWPYFGVMAFIWLLFAWRVSVRNKKKASRSSREEAFREYMHSKMDD